MNLSPKLLTCCLLLTLPSILLGQSCYSNDYVEISEVTYRNDQYSMVLMRRADKRVQAKYFAAKDYEGNSVYERFESWKRANSNVILVSSGTYMDDHDTPQGLTIDNGVMVNSTLIEEKMDALVIVYPNGGIAVSNLEDGNLSVSGGGMSAGRKLDLRNESRDLYDFKKWAQDQEATVFQTHLLVFKNQLEISSYNSSNKKRERRFLAVGKDEDGEIVHIIVHRPSPATLYEASSKTLDFLDEYKYIEVIFMINLDTGNQDVFQLNNNNCTINSTIKGEKSLSQAVNLLVYHFK